MPEYYDPEFSDDGADDCPEDVCPADFGHYCPVCGQNGDDGRESEPPGDWKAEDVVSLSGDWYQALCYLSGDDGIDWHTGERGAR